MLVVPNCFRIKSRDIEQSAIAVTILLEHFRDFEFLLEGNNGEIAGVLKNNSQALLASIWSLDEDVSMIGCWWVYWFLNSDKMVNESTLELSRSGILPILFSTRLWIRLNKYCAKYQAQNTMRSKHVIKEHTVVLAKIALYSHAVWARHASPTPFLLLVLETSTSEYARIQNIAQTRTKITYVYQNSSCNISYHIARISRWNETSK